MTKRQRNYIEAFSNELHRLTDSGEAPDMAERLAHAHAAHLFALDDARSEGMRFGVAVGESVAMNATQAEGGRVKSDKYERAREWARGEWARVVNGGHAPSAVGRLNAAKGTPVKPTKIAFARWVCESGELEGCFNITVKNGTAKTVAGWLSGTK